MMEKIKALIIDDERRDREVLENDIKRYCPEVEILEKCEGAKEGMLAIHKYKPDLIFLDISMNDMDGISMLKCLGLHNINFDIIFTTAHSEYSIEAFKLSAIHYLLKPIASIDLIEAVKRVHQRKNHFVAGEHIHVMEDFPRRIALPVNKGYIFEEINKIIYCKAEGNYSEIFLIQSENPLSVKRLFITRSLKQLDQTLKRQNFRRSHHSYLVNRNHVLNVNLREDYVEVINGDFVPLSRAGKKIFMEGFR